MSIATQATLVIILTTVVLPLSSGALLSFIFSQFNTKQTIKRFAPLLALTLSQLVSFVGILSLGQLWGADAVRYLFWMPLLVGIFWEIGDVLLSRKSNQLWTVLGSSFMLLFGILLTTISLSVPLKGLWHQGINKAILNEFLVPCIALFFLGVRFNLKVINQEAKVAPAQFASVAVTFGVAAPVVGLSGSASLAQLLAAFGLSVAGVGLMALWRGLSLSKSSYVSSYFSLFATLLYAHLYLSPALSPTLFTLLVLSPSCGALSSLWRLSPIKNTFLAIILSMPLSMIALGLIANQEMNTTTTTQDVDEFGASY